MRIFRKILKSKNFKYIMVTSTIGLIVCILSLFYTDRYDIRAWIDATSFTGGLIIAFGWMLFISNEGLFDITIYGIDMFFKALIKGKRPEKSFIEYRFGKEQVHSSVYISVWITGLLFLAITGILYLFYIPLQ